MSSLAYIGLGSNLGNRLSNLQKAKSSLLANPRIKLKAKSSILETKPVDYLPQNFFLNQVLKIKTDYSPLDLLENLQQIEIQMGRTKTISKGPRIIDLDILLYDKIVYNSTDLNIPHPEIMKRKFIIDHILEIDPRAFSSALE